MQPNMIEKITNNISAFAIILIYLGYCNLDFYYSTFNIEIYNYITSSELILSFIPVLNMFLLFFVYIAGYMLIINIIDKKGAVLFTGDFEYLKDLSKVQGIFYKLILILKFYVQSIRQFIMITLLILGIISIIGILNNYKDSIPSLAVFLSIFSMIYFPLIYFLKYPIDKKLNEYP
jgi:hypothetical protein